MVVLDAPQTTPDTPETLSETTPEKSGFIAVTGRPNAGKSTLLNCIAGEKVSIVSHRRQTTRSVIRLITEAGGARIAWLDTPGWQRQHAGPLNRILNMSAEWAVQVSDAVVFVTVAGAWTPSDDAFLQKIPPDKTVICALNKIDRISDKNLLLPMIDELSKKRAFAAHIPLSAKRGAGVDMLIEECAGRLTGAGLPAAARDDYEFFFAELVREKIFRALGDELPYKIGVVVDVAKEDKRLQVAAQIYVERPSQKAIVLGKGGAMLKRIAIAARRDMEKFSGKRVALSNHVKVGDWLRDPALLKRMKIGLPVE